IGELLSRNPTMTSDQDLDDEADRLAKLMTTRVTFIGTDGRVLGDSDLDGQALADVENHLTRPEVQQAGTRGVGVATRYSTTDRCRSSDAGSTNSRATVHGSTPFCPGWSKACSCSMATAAFSWRTGRRGRCCVWTMHRLVDPTSKSSVTRRLPSSSERRCAAG